MIRFFILIILIYLLYKAINAVKNLKPGQKGSNLYQSKSSDGEDLIEDPVCHTYVPVSQAYKREISGKDYYFCSQQCSDKYTIEKK